MPQPRPERRVCAPWLAWIDLPRVEIEDRWTPLLSIAPRYCLVGDCRREQAEEPAARRYLAPRDVGQRNRQLEQLGPRDRAPGMPGRVRPAVMVVPQRRDARRIGIAFLGEHPVCPRRTLVDRKAQCAIAGELLARGILQRGPRALEVGAKGFGGHR